MKELIKVDSVFLNFGAHELLRGVSLQFSAGQVTGILGRNGCGKSSLLKVITGQVQAQSKHLKYQEQHVEHLYKKQGLINYLPQHEFHPSSLRVSELLSFYSIAESDFIAVYPFLEKTLNSKFGRLSGGERRMVEVALILESNSKFSILDEPFTHVMPKYIDLIKARIIQLKHQKGILLTDHQYQNVMEISDQIYFLVNGVAKRIDKVEDLQLYGYIR